MSVQAMAYAFKLDIDPGPKLVMLALSNYADESGICWPSQGRLARDTSMTDRTVRSHLVTLESLGHIERTARRASDGTRTSDLIQINRKDFPLDDNRKKAAPATGKKAHEPPENFSGKPSIEPSSESSAGKSRKRNPETLLPEDWFLPEDWKHEGEKKHPRLDVGREAERFKNHAHQNERRCRNWRAAFRNWLLSAEDKLPKAIPAAPLASTDNYEFAERSRQLLAAGYTPADLAKMNVRTMSPAELSAKIADRKRSG